MSICVSNLSLIGPLAVSRCCQNSLQFWCYIHYFFFGFSNKRRIRFDRRTSTSRVPRIFSRRSSDPSAIACSRYCIAIARQRQDLFFQPLMSYQRNFSVLRTDGSPKGLSDLETPGQSAAKVLKEFHVTRSMDPYNFMLFLLRSPSVA